MRHLDLFAGIGGFSRAVHWLGGETVGFVEWESWNRRVLAKHWPHARFFGDIHDVTADDLARLGAIDLITGGYPCQPFSHAGKRLGTADDRHLWPQMRRVIDLARPRYVLAENVAGHVSMGLDTVLAELEADGYTAGAVIVPACAVNALHRRDRVWIMAHVVEPGAGDSPGAAGGQERQPARTPEPTAVRQGDWPSLRVGADAAGTDVSVADATSCLEQLPGDEAVPGGDRGNARVAHQLGSSGLDQRQPEPGLAHADRTRQLQPEGAECHEWRRLGNSGQGADVGHTDEPGLEGRLVGGQRAGERAARSAGGEPLGTGGDEALGSVDPEPDGVLAGLVRRPAARSAWDDPDLIRAMWADGSWEADLPRVVAEETERRQKLQAAGNAIVPIVAYEILRVMLGGPA